MIGKKTLMAMAFVGAGMFAGMPMLAQAAATTPETKLATQYGVLAGSQANADSLIAGLRDGKPVLLRATPDSTNPAAASTTFTPATGKLGYGNVNIALALAQAALAKQGIASPTPEQLAAALNGGTVMTPKGNVTFAGVLAQRQSGMGWGQIASAMGVKLGSVVSAAKANKPLSQQRERQQEKPKFWKFGSGNESDERGQSGQSHGNSGKSGNNGHSGNSGQGGGNSSSHGSSSSGSSGGGGGGRSK